MGHQRAGASGRWGDMVMRGLGVYECMNSNQLLPFLSGYEASLRMGREEYAGGGRQVRYGGH